MGAVSLGRATANPRVSSACFSLPLTPRAAALDTLPVGARLCVRDVFSLLNCSKSSLLRRLNERRAPAPLPEEAQLTWRAGDVRAWLEGGVAGKTGTHLELATAGPHAPVVRARHRAGGLA